MNTNNLLLYLDNKDGIMTKRSAIILIIFTFFLQFAVAQKGGYHYLPYEMPGHSAVKFNSFLMNPAFPIFGERESHVALYHRNQWMNFKNNFKTYMATYGKKWSDQEMFHGMIFQKKAGVFTNYGVLGNYIHQIEISDENYLRLGINAMFGMTGISKGDVIINNPGDPIFENVSNTGIFNVQPGFDINFGRMHFGVVAENLIDYAISAGEMAVPFNAKSFVGHLMYRNTMMSGSGILEEATFSVMARARRSSENFQFGGNITLDMPLIGWVYGGYDQKYGVFGGLGFNVTSHFSAGFGYEQGIGSYVSNLGGTYEVSLVYQYGGKRHEKARKLEEARKAKEADLDRKKAIEEVKPEVSKETVAEKPKEEAKPIVEQPKDPVKSLQERINVQEHKIAGGKIADGYYVIVGVFRNPKGAYQRLKEVRAMGLTASAFLHPQNGMTYVYFNQPYDSKEDAGLIMSQMLKRREFSDISIWILRVVK
ncbi:hypothetical protein CAPN010_09830 [Capnocytophaga cynodegmi]|uniref:PorP/SprF family type IX secretion system membrane protein n=1 Tax=Capnocytophaga cynodegmi TaxID=28189 RepID=UPI001EE15D2A|nr:PorP/SprF family type IX secretion system membrane protein [Capnocytophaga cynodegmi]GJQ06825.1 hypothetical protein CAPN010_09830 [Capnocytophaga cynodegmi]